MEINNKFNVGDTVYTLYRGDVTCKCNICNGEKEITVLTTNKEELTIPCPTCGGSGVEVHNNIIKVSPALKITNIKINIHRDGISTIRYKLDGYFNIDNSWCSVKNRAESRLFKTSEEANRFLNSGEVLGY